MLLPRTHNARGAQPRGQALPPPATGPPRAGSLGCLSSSRWPSPLSKATLVATLAVFAVQFPWGSQPSPPTALSLHPCPWPPRDGSNVHSPSPCGAQHAGCAAACHAAGPAGAERSLQPHSPTPWGAACLHSSGGEGALTRSDPGLCPSGWGALGLTQSLQGAPAFPCAAAWPVKVVPWVCELALQS